MHRLFDLVLTGAAVALSAASLAAQLVVSANDGKAVLVDGVNTVPRPTPPDMVTILDASVLPPRIVAELPVPNSVIGPPGNVAITPDRTLALVASAVQVDPTDPARTVPDDRITVIDLTARPAAVVATLRAGRGASGVSVNRAGTLALVANRQDGTVSVFRIEGRTVTPDGVVDLGAPRSGPSQVMFTPDGRTALVTRNDDSLVSVLEVSGAEVTYTKRDIAAGLKPYGIDVTPDGRFAVVANIGTGATGGTDTVSVIDLGLRPPRTVDQVPVGIIPEALAISPDGRFVAMTVMNGSNQPQASAWYAARGRLRIFQFEKQTLVPVTETPTGRWCQGVAWSPDSRAVLAQCMGEREIMAFRFDGRSITAAGSVKVNGGPAGIAVR